ncbi:MAG: ribosome silencing factor [Desulfovibrionaceae bacterium]|nr:ribosome silencing factor [Desulfovibrionaceae bacterium]
MMNKPNQHSAPLQERVDAIASVLTEHKALDYTCIDLTEQSGGSFADRLIIVTATSPRHARALADAVSALCHEKGDDFLGIEGLQAGEWVLVDLNDIVVSIFLESTRSLYRLEDLWRQLPREGQHDE